MTQTFVDGDGSIDATWLNAVDALLNSSPADQCRTVCVKDFGAVGDGSAATIPFQAAIDASPSGSFINIPKGDYLVDIYNLNYGAKLIHWVSNGATLNGAEFFNGTVVDGGNGAVNNVNTLVPLNKQVDVYRVTGKQDDAGKLNAFHFELDAGSNSSGTEPVRGLIGRVTNTDGSGEIKAIRVGASDLGTAGATSLVAISADVRPNANTSNAWVVQYSEQADAGVNDKVTGINFDTLNNNRWLEGINFQQGMEVSDAWFQASITPAGSPNGRFLKLKDDPGAAVIFEVDNTGQCRSTNGLYAGEFANGIKVTASTIERTNAAGNMIIRAGTNAGTTLTLGGGGLDEIVVSDDGVSIGAPTGGRQGTGTLNAQAVYDDGVLLTDYVYDLYFDGVLVDSDNDNHKALSFNIDYFDIDKYSELFEESKSLPNMPTRSEWEDKKVSVGDLAQRLWEVVEVQSLHIKQLNDRLKKLEAD